MSVTTVPEDFKTICTPRGWTRERCDELAAAIHELISTDKSPREIANEHTIPLRMVKHYAIKMRMELVRSSAAPELTASSSTSSSRASAGADRASEQLQQSTILERGGRRRPKRHYTPAPELRMKIPRPNTGDRPVSSRMRGRLTKVVKDEAADDEDEPAPIELINVYDSDTEERSVGGENEMPILVKEDAGDRMPSSSSTSAAFRTLSAAVASSNASPGDFIELVVELAGLSGEHRETVVRRLNQVIRGESNDAFFAGLSEAENDELTSFLQVLYPLLNERFDVELTD